VSQTVQRFRTCHCSRALTISSSWPDKLDLEKRSAKMEQRETTAELLQRSVMDYHGYVPSTSSLGKRGKQENKLTKHAFICLLAARSTAGRRRLGDDQHINRDIYPDGGAKGCIVD
jgi:hypothetical protein